MSKCCPQAQSEQGQREEQMDRQIEMAHGGAVHQSAGDHDPAGKCLGNEKHAHHEIDAKLLERDAPREKESKNGDRVEQSSKACDEAM